MKSENILINQGAALPQGSIVAVIGAGTMGEGIAQVLLLAGYKVSLYDQSTESLERAVISIGKRLNRLVEKKQLTEELSALYLSSLSIVSDLSNLNESVMIVEAIVENLSIKQKLFKDLEKIVSKETIFASNTSSISITAIGSVLKDPTRLAGWHFFNPAPLMKLVEVVKGLETSEKVAEILYETARHCQKTPVYAKSTPGFIVNRVARPFYSEGLRFLLESGEDISDLDILIRESGNFRMGPFELMDLIGNDINYAVTTSVWESFYYDERFTPSLIQKEYVDAGFYGRKSGRGFYNYENSIEEKLSPAPSDGPNLSHIKIDQNSIAVNESSNFFKSWSALLERQHISYDVIRNLNSSFLLELEGIAFFVTNGLSAAEVAYQTGYGSVVLLDLAFDYEKVKYLGVTRNHHCSDTDFQKAIKFFEMLEIRIFELKDIPGMLVMRTVVMLINEASDLVSQGVSEINSIDIAMKLGVGYPMGPLEWADNIGIEYVHHCLNNLANTYGESRYRVSPKLREYYFSGRTFYD